MKQAEVSDMSINKQSDEVTNLQIGPTDQGMVRIYVATDSVQLPMDFDPDEAEDIAQELINSAKAARDLAKK